MKILKILLLLSLLTGIGLIADLINKQPVKQLMESQSGNIVKNNSNSRTTYNINVEYKTEDNLFSINEKIKWKNIDSLTVDTLYFNFPHSTIDNINSNSLLTYKINSFLINGKPAYYNFINNYGKNFLDSTLIKVILQKGIVANETISFEVNYNMSFTDASAFSEVHFYNFENWYVTIAPYLSGKFYKYPLNKIIEPFLEYSDFNLKLEIPKDLDIATSGKIEKEIGNNSTTFSCSDKHITRFNWFAFNDLSKYERKVNTGNKEVQVIIFIKESKDGYVERYFDAIEKYLKSLSEYALYPFENLTIVDLPNINNLKSRSYAGLISLKSDLISPIETQKLEYNLAFLIAEQYFGNIITSNCMEDSWLSKGISAYIAEKLVRKNFGDLKAYFNVADYYPIFGLHFMSYRGIPLIYTIGGHVIPEGGRYIDEYYSNLIFADLSIPAYMLPTYSAYRIFSIVKPQIALLTMEKFIGADKFESKLKKYFQNNLYKYPNSKDFLRIMSEGLTKENQELYNELFTSDKTFDYAITSIEKRNRHKYDIMVERIGSGVTPIKLNINRELDTLQFYWDGKGKYKIFAIDSYTEIISAEIDSDKKNLLDLNFANNSYIVEEQYWGTISYATRVFFWFQNALMLIGGKG